MKIYLSTKMNGLTPEQITKKYDRFREYLDKDDNYKDAVFVKDAVFINPYNPELAKENFVKEGVLKDKKPIEMLSIAISKMADATHLVFLGNPDELKDTRGCRVELFLAKAYGINTMYFTEHNGCYDAFSFSEDHLKQLLF